MKFAAALAAIGLVSTQADAFNLLKDVNPQRMDDWEFLEKSSYATWNGFVRGLYREKAHNIISDSCLGDWVLEDVKKIDTFG